MKWQFAALLAGGVHAGESFAPGEVHVLTNANFDSYLKDHDAGALVKFYAPWCGHCKRMEPEFVKAAADLHKDGVKIPLGKVDATVETELASKFQVQGYPTLKYFTGGEASEYDGGRDAAGIADWIKSMAGPAVLEEAPGADDKFQVVFSSKEKSEDFENLAKANRKAAKWYFVKSDEGPTKMTIKHKGEPSVEEEAVADRAAMDKFFAANKFPVFGELNGDTFSNYISRGNGLVWALMPMEKDTVEKVVEENREMFTEVAKKFHASTNDDLSKTYSLAWTNTVEFAKVMESMFGITEFPRVVVQKKAGDKKAFVYDGEMTAEKIIEYIEKVNSGEIKAHMKSEDAPAEPQKEPVKMIVGSTIESLVFQEEQDVLLEIYAPWCGHCKKLEPEYIKLGKKVQKEQMEDIMTIAKLDGTANDSPVDELSWSGFPTIYYIPAGAKPAEVKKYDGGRDAKAMWQWIKKNHSKADELKTRLAGNKESREKKDEAPKEEKKKEEL